MLFDTAMKSYNSVATESLETVAENYTGTKTEATNREYAEIMCEHAMDMANLESALYVADVVIEGKILDGKMSRQQAVYVAEGAVGDFVRKVREKLVALWNKIKDWFTRLFKSIKVYTMNAKKFVKEYETEIRYKAKKSDIEFKTYKYSFMDGVAKVQEFLDIVTVELAKLCGEVDSVNGVDEWTKKLNNSNAIKIKENGAPENTFWENCSMGDSWAEVREEIYKVFRGGTTTNSYTASELPIDDMIKFIKSDTYITTVNDSFSEINKVYKKSIDRLASAEKLYNSKNSENLEGKEEVSKFVRATSQSISALTALVSNAQQCITDMGKEFISQGVKICKALVARKVKESYVVSNTSGSESLLESALRLV